MSGIVLTEHGACSPSSSRGSRDVHALLPIAHRFTNRSFDIQYKETTKKELNCVIYLASLLVELLARFGRFFPRRHGLFLSCVSFLFSKLFF